MSWRCWSKLGITSTKISRWVQGSLSSGGCWRGGGTSWQVWGWCRPKFGSVLFHVEVFNHSCITNCAQYPLSSARYNQFVSSPYFATPGAITRMFWARFFLLLWSGAPNLRLLSHHNVRSWVGIWSSEFLTTFPMKVSCCLASWCRMVVVLKNRFRTDSFLSLSSITIVVVILIIFLIFLWRNTSSFFNVASKIAQL